MSYFGDQEALQKPDIFVCQKIRGATCFIWHKETPIEKIFQQRPWYTTRQYYTNIDIPHQIRY